MYIYVYIHTCVQIYIYIRVYIYVYMYIHMYMCTYTSNPIDANRIQVRKLEDSFTAKAIADEKNTIAELAVLLFPPKFCSDFCVERF